MSPSGKDPIKVLIIDDHAVLRTALGLVLSSHDGMSLVGEAGTSEEAISLAKEKQPDIILLDVDLGDESGLDLLPELRSVSANSRVIMLTGVREVSIHQKAVERGALGIVRKDKAMDVLIAAIERVHAGEAWLDPALTAKLLSSMSAPKKEQQEDKLNTLTPREREVVVLIGQGLKNKEIAAKLFISEWTVRHHITSIFAKLEITDRVDLVLYALRNDLVNP